ncbi:hypothetical protein [Luteibacter sp. Lutesp34]|uniref:hypothetical protein n=1 Tax=Luteibacter sp. Lutesp34 TaxID=3243030 RepID=UPI0039B50CEF
MAKNSSEPTGSSPVITHVSSSTRSRGKLVSSSGEFRTFVDTATMRRRLRENARRIHVAQNPIPTMPGIADALVGSRGTDVLRAAVFDGSTTDIEATCAKWASGQPGADNVWINIYAADAGGHPVEPALYDGFAAGDSDRIEDLDDPMVKTFPLSVLPTAAGEDQFFVLRFVQGSGFGDEYFSQDYAFEADRRAPGGDSLVHPFIDPNVIRNGLTTNYLDANGGKLLIVVDPYDDQQPGDVLQAFMQVVGGTAPVPTLAKTVTDEGNVVTLEFLKDDLIAGGINGKVEVWLTCTDIAGNTATSPMIQFDTLLANAPSGFSPIFVPEHDNNGDLLTDTEARLNPAFFVPGYVNAVLNDVVRVVVFDAAGNEIMFEDIPVTDPAADPIVSGAFTLQELYVIQEAYGGDPVFSFTMTYRIMRNPFIVDTLQVTTINCDLTLPGGPDPDPETPINENLQPPTISGDNVIDEAEFSSPASTLVPFEAVDGTPAFELADAVQLFITDMSGGNRVPVGLPVSVTDPTADLTTIQVPAAMLVVGRMYFQYSLSRVVTGNKTVMAWSPIQPVTVRSSDGLPGGPNFLPLDKSIFRDADQSRGAPVRPSYSYTRVGDIVNGRPNPYRDMLVRIHYYENMAVGDVIKLTLEGSHTFPDYGPPAPDATFEYEHTVNGTDLTSRPTAIPEDALPGTNPPVAEPDQFVDFVIPYEDVRKVNAGQPGLGSMRVSYEITNAQGSNTSDPAVVLFATIDVRAPA